MAAVNPTPLATAPGAKTRQAHFTGLNLYQLVCRLTAQNTAGAGGYSGRGMAVNDNLADGPNDNLVADPQRSDVLTMLEKSVRFKANISFEHPRHEIAAIDTRQTPAVIHLNRFILAGLLGPLPEPYVELCYQRMRAGDHSMAAFLDIFNHRINLLRYWLKVRRYADLSPLPAVQSLPGQLLIALCGCSDAPVPLRRLMGLASLMHHARRSLDTVQTLLRRLLQLPVTLRPLQGGWLPIRPQERCQLGRANSVLGENIQLGTRFWDQHKGIALEVPVDTLDRLQTLLPGGRRHRQFAALVRWLTHFRFDIHVRLCIPKRYRSPALRARNGMHLGYSSWLNHTPKPTQHWDVCYTLHAQTGEQHATGA